MEMVHRLPCNWKQIDDRDLIGTVEYTPVDPMHHVGCRGEVRLCRLMSRGVASLGNHRRVMTTIAYLTLFLPSPRLRRRCCLPVFGEEQREREDKDTGERERGEVLTAFVIVVIFDG